MGLEGGSLFRRESLWRPIAVIVAALVAVLAVTRLTTSASPAPSPSHGIASAIEACSHLNSDVKAGGPLSWQLAVRLDSPMQTNLIFVSGSARLTCTADRRADGSYFSYYASMDGGASEPFVRDALTYEIGGVPSEGEQYPTQLVVGRMPSATARIEIVTGDGERHDATLGTGWYMGYANVSDGTRVTAIVAYDSAGKVVARLADPDGVVPGASASGS